jgi:hypothetical protein
MVNRCTSDRNREYKNYGGRGIRICQQWLDYKAFAIWATTNGYKTNLTLERKNVNGNYEPENCTWATMKEQNNNRTNNHLITFGGKTQTLQQWSEEFGIKKPTLLWRLGHGWPLDQAFTVKVRRYA